MSANIFWDSCENCNSSRVGNSDCCDILPMDDSFIDKENNGSHQGKYDGDLSLYESNSPTRMSCDGSPPHCSYTARRLLDEHDSYSQDSGYSACESSKFSSPKSRALSFGSCVSIDEALLDFSELEQENENTELPGDFNKLITGSLAIKEIKKSPEVMTRPPLRRALSLISNMTPNTSQARSCLFKHTEETEIRNFKRPEPPTDLHSPVNSKRSRIFQENQLINRIPARPVYQRSFSATEDSIKSALLRSSTQPDLIGDFTKSFCLPLIPGRHQDLKSISPSTLNKLLKGEYANDVASFRVIDCRYPYEFEGGHITGAQNLYTKEQIEQELLNSKMTPPQASESQKRHILVFHCEFSSERGPNLSRFLRKLDRTHNKDYYPNLHYPEVYLLDGGYKSFYENFAELCAPNGYLPMHHPDHEHNLRYFRAKSKTWNADSKSKSNIRPTSFRRL